jgi:hypothetical protein
VAQPSDFHPASKVTVAKRTPLQAAPPKVRPPQQTRTAWATERHSGEGAASALETLQKMEKRRVAGRPADPQGEEPGS